MKQFLFCLFVLQLTLLKLSIAQAAIEKNAGNQQSEIQSHFEVIKSFLPAAKRVSELEGKPLSAEVYGEADKVIGYAYYTDDVIKIPAYSGKLIHTLVVFDVRGKISGVKIIKHQEPILVVGISDDDLNKFIAQYPGKHIRERIRVDGTEREGYRSIDAISGATITVMVLNESITRSLRKVGKVRRIR